MIPQLQENTVNLSNQTLSKKKINFTTLQTILERSGANQEFVENILKEIEGHIRLRNEKRVINRIRNESPVLIKAFENHYSIRYANTSLKSHSFHVGKFLGYILRTFPGISPLQSIHDCKKITKAMVISYQEHHVNDMQLGKLKKSTVNRYLFSMKLFLDMLSILRVNHIRYIIPSELRAQANRANEYVQTDEIAALVESIEKSQSKMKIRDMSIILMIMELGCRPIEVGNIHLDDIRLTDRLVTLRSVKSKTRTLQMSKDLSEIIKKYVETIRSPCNCEHSALFIRRSTYGFSYHHQYV